MEIIHIRVLIIILATTIAIDSAILAYILPQHSSIILTIEIILLPLIYIVGNYCIEELIKKQYEKIILTIQEEADKLRDKYLKEKYLNKDIKNEKKKRKKEN